MFQTEQNAINEFLVYESNRLVSKATYDDLAESKLKSQFNLVRNPKNWKLEVSIHLEDFVKTHESRDHFLNNTIRHMAALIWFTGGVEFTVLSKHKILVSSKGYYHYIGA